MTFAKHGKDQQLIRNANFNTLPPKEDCTVPHVLMLVVVWILADMSWFMTRLLTDYYLLTALYDKDTSMYVELADNRNFSSTDTQIAIFDKPLEKRWRLQTGVVMFDAGDVPDGITLQFRNGCYTLIYDFDLAEILYFQPSWSEGEGSKKICIRIISGDGKRTLRAPIDLR